jgi:hypothetical protein
MLREKNKSGVGASGSNPSPPGPADTETVDFDTQFQYIKISHKNKEKSIINYCKCWSCDSVKDFAIAYYSNSAILRDNDRSVHIPKVMK